MTGRGHRAVVLMAVLLTAVAGCGKKPDDLSLPKGVASTGFPHVYPSPSREPDAAGRAGRAPTPIAGPMTAPDEGTKRTPAGPPGIGPVEAPPLLTFPDRTRPNP